MTGAEHYREAERLAAIAVGGGWSSAARAEAIPLAQVHATLALAAATALCHPGDDETPPEVANAWYEAAGKQPTP